MSIIHFLNVNEGDCNIIQHDTGHVTVIDVCNGNAKEDIVLEYSNHRQKEHPVDPISYLSGLEIDSIFRFILTHPAQWCQALEDHGDNSFEQLSIPPADRPLFIKGEVRIGNNVWIGRNVCIMPGVTIGDGAVIGANAVITHDIPPYSVAAGVPAKIIKKIE